MRGSIFYDWPGSGCPSAVQFPPTENPLSTKPYDVVIIGAGVIGAALAYRLSQYQLRLLAIDRRYDVGEGTSKGSSAIIHTGFDAAAGTLESQLVTRAAGLWPDLAAKLKIPFRRCGAVLVAINEEQEAQLEKLRQKAVDNGVLDVELLSAAAVRQLVPAVNPAVRGGMSIPRESIIDPFSVSIAFSEVALTNGADLLLGAEVVDVQDSAGPIKQVMTTGGRSFATRLIVNAAGLGGSGIANQYGGKHFDLNPRRGQFIVFDEAPGSAPGKILLPIPTAQTKGVLVIPTIFGNLLAGPTAEDLPLGDDTACETTSDGLAMMLQGAANLMPGLAHYPRMGSFAGTRCACKQGSYIIRFNDGGPGLVTVSGIRSTGITSCPAVADYLVEGLARECNLQLVRAPDAVDHRPANAWPGWWKKPHRDPAQLKHRPDYARILCNCRDVSKGEITDALNSPLHPFTLDAIKRRTCALTGRCQGFDCALPVARMIASHTGIALDEITKNGPGSELAVHP